MIIWRKWGILVPILLFAVLVVTEIVVDSIAGEGTYTASSPLWPGVGLIIGGVLTYLFAQWEAGRNRPRVLVDKETGQEVTQTDRSDLFFVPIRYWGMLAIGVGVVMVVLGFLDAGGPG